MAKLVEKIKYSSAVVGVYDKILDSRCKDVEAYIFVATTGRSGSESLSRIFEAADRAVCFHEPYPIMFSDYPDPDHREEYFRDLFYQRKRINVKRSAAGYRYYVETNHQFVKNYFPYAADTFQDKLRVIHMYRDPVRVAASFYAIQSVPGKTHAGRHYLLDPKRNDNELQIADLLENDPDFSHDMYRCLWYWYEIEARVKAYKKQFPNVVWHSMATNDMNDEKALVAMFTRLGVKFDSEKLKSLVGSRANTKTAMKKKQMPIEEVEVMNAKLLAKLEERFGKDFLS